MEEDRRTQLLNARPVWVIEHVGTMIKVFIPRKQQTFYANVGEEIEWTLLDGSTQKVNINMMAPWLENAFSIISPLWGECLIGI